MTDRKKKRKDHQHNRKLDIYLVQDSIMSFISNRTQPTVELDSGAHELKNKEIF